MNPPNDPIVVLHVDDDEGFLELAAEVLPRQDSRLSIKRASDPQQALGILDQTNIDCVISDYEMNPSNGIEFLRSVRENHGAIPFILFTGKGSEEIASEAISAGVTDYLNKQNGLDQFAILANRVLNAVEAVRSKRALEERTERLETLISNLPGMVYRCDNEPKWPIQFVAGEFQELTGYNKAELTDGGVDFGEIIHPADQNETWQTVQQAVSLGDPFEVTYRLIDRNGSIKWVWERGRCVNGHGSETETIEGFITDITSRREREERIEALHEATRDLLDAESKQEVADAIAKAAKFALGYSNNIVRLFDPDRSELIPVTVESSEIPTDLDKRPTYGIGEETAGLAFERGEPLVYDDVRAVNDDRDRDGAQAGMYLPIGTHGVLTITETATGVFDETDVHLGSILTANAAAVFDRVLQSQELRERRKELERYETIVEALGDPVYAIDADGIFTYVNDAYVDETGYDREELLGGHVSITLSDSDIEKGNSVIRGLLANDDMSKATVDVNRRTASGDIVPVEIHIAQLPEGPAGEFQGTAGVIRDISDRKQRLHRIESLHQSTRRLLRAESAEEVAEITADAAKNTLGYTSCAVRLLADDGSKLIPVAVTEEARENVGDRPTYEIGEGTAGLAYERGEPVVYDDVQAIDDGFDRGQARSGMYVPIGRYGVLTVVDYETGVLDDSDIQLASILTANAASVLHQLEQSEKLQQRERELARQNDRLETFAHIISHDIRNPLSVAKGNLELALEEYDDEHLDHIDGALDRINGLINDVSTFINQGRSVENFEYLSISRLVETSWTNVVTKNADLVNDCDPEVLGDGERLKSVFENLFRNAVEHSATDVTVHVGNLPNDNGIFVEDDGDGIDPALTEKIFESGFSTKNTSSGLGLGIVKQIIEAHNWEIQVTESHGGGVRFEITTNSPQYDS